MEGIGDRWLAPNADADRTRTATAPGPLAVEGDACHSFTARVLDDFPSARGWVSTSHGGERLSIPCRRLPVRFEEAS